jgi:hypothetical protein
MQGHTPSLLVNREGNSVLAVRRGDHGCRLAELSACKGWLRSERARKRML